MKRQSFLFASLLAFVLPVAVQAADKPRICFVYPGSRNDGGWSQAQDEGRQMLAKELSGKVTTEFVENVAEGEGSKAVFKNLASSGCNMIFATAFGYMDAVMDVAAKYPDVRFENAMGYKTTRNVSAFNARFYQGRYLTGRIAAKVSKSGKAVYVAPFPIPDVIQGVNAFQLGAQSVNPKFRTNVVWTGSWFDPEKEAKAVEDAVRDGADIVSQQTDSTAPLQVAQKLKIHGFGYGSDMISVAQDAELTSIVYNWGVYDVARVKAYLAGDWVARQSWNGLKTGIFKMAPYRNMPDKVTAFARLSEAMMKSEKLKPFRGPVKRQNGKVWLKKGALARESELLDLNFLVEGVEGEIPKH